MLVAHCLIISIHAPTRGATFEMEIFPSQRDISIHAPTRGATTGQLRHSTLSLYFNPRSYKRSDVLLSQNAVHHMHFNPRSYKRSDSDYYTYLPTQLISIHAPTRGATGAVLWLLQVKLFQSTLLQEERHETR